MSKRRQGFSLIEALVVLAVGGMAIAIIFTIGVKAGDTGFSLGRRAMSAAERDIAVSDLRASLRSLSVRPAAAFNPALDRPIAGEPRRLVAEAVMERATQCAPMGWAGSLVLTIEDAGDHTTLFCEAAGRKTALLTDNPPSATFSYSRDGRTWTSTFDNTPTEADRLNDPRSDAVFVRFRGTADILERAESARPFKWIRLDGAF